MPIQEMNHFTVLTADLDKTKSFYTKILGLTEGFRPQFSDSGAWLYAKDRAVLHVMADCKMPAEPAGVLDHMAFSANDLIGTIQRLKEMDIKYLVKRQVTTGTLQLFCHDPSGAKVELDFSRNESVTGIPGLQPL